MLIDFTVLLNLRLFTKGLNKKRKLPNKKVVAHKVMVLKREKILVKYKELICQV